MSTITTTARAVDICVHVPIDPPRLVAPDEHPSAGDDFVADTALWAWSTVGGSVVSLHSLGRMGTCLAFYHGDPIPAWLPRPPAAWNAAADAFTAAVKPVLS